VLVSQASPIPFHSADHFQYRHMETIMQNRIGLACETSLMTTSHLSQGKGPGDNLATSWLCQVSSVDFEHYSAFPGSCNFHRVTIREQNLSLLQLDWMAGFSLLQPDVARTEKRCTCLHDVGPISLADVHDWMMWHYFGWII